MASDNEVIIKLLADTRDAVDKLARFEKEAKGFAGGAEKAFGALKVAAVAAVGFLAGREVLDFFSNGIAAAKAQQDAMTRLATALDLTGEKSDEALKSFENFADEMERTSKFGDDLVLSQLAVAKSFGVTNDQAEKLVKAAIELSSATGQSLDSAVQALGKTFSGVTGKLDEQIPVLKSLTKEQLASGEALNVVLDRFGGSAAREIETFSGALLQLENSFGNLQESFGVAIVENQAVIAAFQAITDALRKLETFVKNNREEVNDFITFMVRGFAVSLPVATTVLEFFIKNLQAMVAVGSLSFTALLKVTELFARGFGSLIKTQSDVFLTFVEGLLYGIDNIPGVGKALGAVGLDAGKAADDVEKLRSKFNRFVDQGVDGVGDLQKKSQDFTENTVKKFEKFNDGFDKFQGAVDQAVQGVFDADGRIIESGKKAADKRREFVREVAVDAKELKKLAEEVLKFEQMIAKEGAREIDNLTAKRDEQLKKIAEFEQARVVSTEKAAALRETVEKNTADKILKLRKEENEKLLAEQKKLVEEAANNPVGFTVTALFDGFILDQESLRGVLGQDLGRLVGGVLADVSRAIDANAQAIGASVGLLGNILDGAAGAKKAIAAGAGAIGDALVPGIGGAVQSVVSKLAEGPDATKQFVKEFVAAVPDIITAIAESVPVVVEALVDSLINEGGIIRIAVALQRAIFGEAIFKAIGREIGLEFGRSLNINRIGQTFAGEVTKGLSQVGPAISQALFSSIGQIPDLIARGAVSFVAGVKEFFQDPLKFLVTGAFAAPIEFFQNILPGKISDAAEKFSAVVKGFGDKIRDLYDFKFPEIRPPTFTLPEWMNGFTEAVHKFFQTPQWIKQLQDIVDKFEALGGGGSTSSGDTGKKSPIPFFRTTTPSGGGGGGILGFGAKGLVVPPGFPNDSFTAGISSGERVLTSEETDDLGEILSTLRRQAQGLGSGGGGMLQVVLKVGESEMAKVLLDLNRQGFRTA